MRFRNNTNYLDSDHFDLEHDLDLVAMLNNARTEGEIRQAVQMGRARMRARAGEQRSLTRRIRAVRSQSRSRG